MRPAQKPLRQNLNGLGVAPWLCTQTRHSTRSRVLSAKQPQTFKAASAALNVALGRMMVASLAWSGMK